MSQIIAGLLSGVIGAMGLGGGAVLLIYLTLFGGVDQLKAQGINLLFFIPIAVVSVAIYAFKKQIDFKTVILFGAAGLCGATAGVFLTEWVGSALLSKIFGGALVAAGVRQAVTAFKKR